MPEALCPSPPLAKSECNPATSENGIRRNLPGGAALEAIARPVQASPWVAATAKRETGRLADERKRRAPTGFTSHARLRSGATCTSARPPDRSYGNLDRRTGR